MERNSLTLCCVGLVFSSWGRRQIGQQGQVDVEDVVPSNVIADLADGFQEGQSLYVSDRAAHLDYYHVYILLAGEAGDAFLDHGGNMGNGLNGASQEVAPPFLGYKSRIYVSGSKGWMNGSVPRR